jgi:polyhydroxyalkanoate synthesis regulator phasin
MEELYVKNLFDHTKIRKVQVIATSEEDNKTVYFVKDEFDKHGVVKISELTTEEEYLKVKDIQRLQNEIDHLQMKIKELEKSL